MIRYTGTFGKLSCASAAANLLEVLNFYNQRFQMNLTEDQKSALVAFLNAL